MTFRIQHHNEPVLNGWTHRPASWPTRQAAQDWIEYWSRLFGKDTPTIIELTHEEQ